MSENQNTNQDAFKTILNAGISALTGGAHDAGELIEHVLQNVEIPEQFKGTVESLAAKGESMLKGMDLGSVVSSLTGAASQVEEKAQGVAADVEQKAQTAVADVEQKAQGVGDDAHSAVMSMMEQLSHGQLTEIMGKAAGLISSLTEQK
ncbi:hypothetical protein LJC33_06160 [Eubacteriales bacterium OttesenSCG-928-N13]|nr:hypothetical protein [Eubacteriales bacterium OttesenSCG-928-N13]